jgi:hypothetical protein
LAPSQITNNPNQNVVFTTNRFIPNVIAYNPQPTVYNPQSTVYNPQPTVYNPQPTVYNPQPTIYNPQPTVYNPQPTIYNSKLEQRNINNNVYRQTPVEGGMRRVVEAPILIRNEL